VGQLGDGAVVDRRLPNRVPGVANATGVAAGGLHSLADPRRLSRGRGGGTCSANWATAPPFERHVAGQVWGLTNAKAVAAGSYHSLALRTGGTVATWG